MNPNAGIMRLLLSALRNLAADAQTQLESLKRGEVWNVAELALEHEHWAHSAIRAGILTPDQAAAVIELDTFLDQISGKENARLWTREALRTAPEWEKARELARAALGLLPAG